MSSEVSSEVISVHPQPNTKPENVAETAVENGSVKAPEKVVDNKSDSKTRCCENCGFELDGSFCGKCGQPEQSMIRFFGSVIMHFLDDVFGFDSRAGRTLVPLIFRPGFLTNEYIRGRRVHYVPPLRLYFFVSIIFFIMLGFFTDDSVKDLNKLTVKNDSSITQLDGKINKLKDKMEGKGYVFVTADQSEYTKLLEQREETKDTLRKQMKKMQDNIDEITNREKQPGYIARPEDAPQKDAYVSALKTMQFELDGDPRGAELERIENRLFRLERKQNQPGYVFDQDDVEDIKELTEEKAELLSDNSEGGASEEDNSDGFNIVMDHKFDFLNEEQNQQLKDFFKEMDKKAKKALEQDAGPLVKQILGVLPQAMFVLLPIFALLLKIFFLFSKRYYMEHLTVALHSHAFMFVVLMLFALLSTLSEQFAQTYTTFGEVIEYTIVALAIWVPIYLFIMQKRVYKQGYFFTFVKFGMIGITYMVLLLFTTVVAFFWGLAKL